MGTERTTKYVLSVALCVGVLGSHVWASGSFLEDFRDGNIQDASPVTWRWDPSMGACAVTPGGLRVTPTWTGQTMVSLEVYAQDAYGKDVHYTGNVTVRAQVKVPEASTGFGSSAFVYLRTNGMGDGYVLVINRRYLWIGRLDDNVVGYSPWEWHYQMNGRFDATEDVIIQLDVIDLADAAGNRTTSRLEGRWWTPSQEMPAQPQVVATDAKYDAGGIGIGNLTELELNSAVVFRWVQVTGSEVEPIVDFNGDGKVEMKDLLKLIESWGQDDPAVDIVPDGIVDKKDLEVLMDHWQQDVNDPTLLAHWAFDEAQGDLACDSTGLCDAALVGDPAWDPDGGQIDGALRLDGLDDCAVTPFVVNPADGPFSVFAWVKGGAPGQIVLSQIGGANWLMASTSDGALATELRSTRGGSLPSETVVTDGNWHRVGLVWDGYKRILYVDDIEVASDTQASLAGTHKGLYLGAGSALVPASFWSGLIDEIRIYNRAVQP